MNWHRLAAVPWLLWRSQSLHTATRTLCNSTVVASSDATPLPFFLLHCACAVCGRGLEGNPRKCSNPWEPPRTLGTGVLSGLRGGGKGTSVHFKVFPPSSMQCSLASMLFWGGSLLPSRRRLQGYLVIRNRHPVGPYGRAMPRALWWF